MADGICPCGAVLEPSARRPRKFCSKKCSGNFYYRRPPRSAEEKCSVDGCTRSRAAKGMCLPHRSAEFRREQAAKGIKRKPQERRNYPHAKTCEYCRMAFKTHDARARFCSLSCSGRSQSTKSRELVLYTGPPFIRKPKINKNPIPERVGRFKSGSCKVCKSWFLSLFGDATCSADCQAEWKKKSPSAIEGKRLARDRRRARKRDAFVENVYRKKIYERDKYSCQLKLPGCKGINPQKAVPHPKAPTLDHIIPLAQGGTHEPKNCHTACFYCNCKKSAGGGGEQLLLIG